MVSKINMESEEKDLRDQTPIERKENSQSQSERLSAKPKSGILRSLGSASSNTSRIRYSTPDEAQSRYACTECLELKL